IRFLKERRVYAAVQRAIRQAILDEAHMPGWGNDTGINKQSAMNRAPISNEGLPSESIELDLDIEEEIVGTQFIASSNGDETSAYPRDNPWITVTEEETGTKPPLLSRLWQSHVHGHDDQINDTASMVSTDRTPTNRTPANGISTDRASADRTPARGVTTFQDTDSQGRDTADIASSQE